MQDKEFFILFERARTVTKSFTFFHWKILLYNPQIVLIFRLLAKKSQKDFCKETTLRKGHLYSLEKGLRKSISPNTAKKCQELLKKIALYERYSFQEAYAQFDAGGRALESLGISEGSERLRDCVVKADVSRLLKPDTQLEQMMDRISKDYFTFLITESRRDDAIKKLHALGLCPSMFKFTSYWDTSSERKHTGTIYPLISNLNGFKPEEHLYVGDKLNDDILPAKRVGLKTVLVGSNSSEADYSISNIHELESLLYGR